MEASRWTFGGPPTQNMEPQTPQRGTISTQAVPRHLRLPFTRPVSRVPVGSRFPRPGYRENPASVAPIASIVARAFHRSAPLKMNEKASTSPFSAVT